MQDGLTVKLDVHFGVGRQSKKTLHTGERPAVPKNRIPRVAKLMALAIRFERLIVEGIVADQAELARLGHVSRPRMTQIMNLLNLAPEIQEALLFLPPVEQGRDPITERKLRTVVAEIDWRKQRRMWRHLAGKIGVPAQTHFTEI
jgi:hypothetical protein